MKCCVEQAAPYIYVLESRYLFRPLVETLKRYRRCRSGPKHRIGFYVHVRDRYFFGTATVVPGDNHEIEKPPSMAKICPVVFFDSSDARNSAVIATSSGSTRPSN